jgi:hypothetical protein
LEHPRIRWTITAALAAFAWTTAVAGAADLSGLDRTLKKEPVYTGKPGYCLAVFGPKAEQRVWLILDGDRLYVDRNGNGDLTEPGERVERQKGRRREPFTPFVIDTMTAGGPECRDLSVVVPDDRTSGAFMSVALDGGRTLEYAGYGEGGLHFAESAAAAPVVHFGGPLTMRFSRPAELSPGVDRELYVELGRHGHGKGAWVSLSYGKVPDDLHPVAEIALPGPDGAVRRSRVVLKQRC